MKIAAIIVRSLLGLGFVVFGLNGLHPFMPMPQNLPPLEVSFFTLLMMQTHYMAAVSVFDLLGGLLTLSGRFTPLGLTILGPILVNILIFHTTVSSVGIGMALIFVVIYLFCLWAYRANFASLFAAPVAE